MDTPYKNIEDIVVGDQVVGWTGEERDIAKVTDIHPTILGDRKLYGINGLDIRFTIEHPFLTKDGWKSVKPDNGTDYGNLVVGDEINIETEWIVIESINEYDGDFNQPVYNFTVETLNSYIANGIVVHNK